MLDRLTRCVAYQYDILLYGASNAELQKRQNALMEQLKSVQFTVNENKSVSITTALSFCDTKCHRLV